MAYKQEQYECGPINKRELPGGADFFPVVAFLNAQVLPGTKLILRKKPQEIRSFGTEES